MDRLIRGSSRHRKAGESSEIVENVNSSQRSAGLGPKRSKEPPGTGTRTPNLTEFRFVVEQELKRERNLIWKADEDEHTETGASWGMEKDLYLISKIEIEPFFLTKTRNKKDGRRSSMEVGRVVSGTMSKNEASKDGQVKKKFLGDYVSEAKMRTVRESCRQIYGKYERLHHPAQPLIRSFEQMIIIASVPVYSKRLIRCNIRPRRYWHPSRRSYRTHWRLRRRLCRMPRLWRSGFAICWEAT